MPNNIKLLQNDLERKKRLDDEAAIDYPDTDTLTDEDLEFAKKIDGTTQTVVIEKSLDGESSAGVPIEDYAESVGSELHNGVRLFNDGDVKSGRSLKSAMSDVYDKFSREISAMESEEEHAIIKMALDVAAKKTGKANPTSSDVEAAFKKMSFAEISETLPGEFMDEYATGSTDRIKKRRVISALSYLFVSGPEADTLNEYIDREHRLMTVTKRLAEYDIDLMNAIQSGEPVGELLKKAGEIEPPDNSAWALYIKGNPKAAHSDFAQRAALHDHYVKAYMEILKEYESDPDSAAVVQEQIEESKAKRKAYEDVFKLETFKAVWGNLADQIEAKPGRKATLDSWAKSGLDRIKRSKVNVPFPAYDPMLVKKTDALYKHYKKSFMEMIRKYNSTILAAKMKATPEELAEMEGSGVMDIRIDGINEAALAEYFAILLLIAFGRVLKKLTGEGTNGYDAIMCDAYFRLYCKIGADIYLMTDVWKICEHGVLAAVKTWR